MSMSILVADDDPVIRRLFEKRLQDAGYAVQVAEDGMQAGALLAESHFDVVITDLVMPGDIGGIELLQIAKDNNPLTEVIVITAHSSIDTAVSAMKKGAADYLEKPVNFDELFLRLEKINELRSLIRNADDLRNAMEVTESNAAQTIGDLELRVSDLQLKLDTMEEIIMDSSLECQDRLEKCLAILHG